ncbi:hypothetical protein HU200_049460 [Digitaria exilis]|uniref:NB-ARC domain-containing protein n=1 Tax=Digitaria exilis TaxID=1010633 RepID=A0A835AZ91_9POAL|nr:hypothetical protein HU200_049460 [Digitaria exilis]
MAAVLGAFMPDTAVRWRGVVTGDVARRMGVAAEAKALAGSLERAGAAVLDAEERAARGDDGAARWLANVRAAAYDADAAVDRCRQALPRLLSSCCDAEVAGGDIAADIRSLNRKLQVILKEKNRLQLRSFLGDHHATPPVRSALRHHRQSQVTFTPPPHNSDIVGSRIEDDTAVLVRHLTKASSPGQAAGCEIVAITGPDGIGKTTLAARVYGSKRIRRGFGARSWVRVPREYTEAALLSLVVDSFGGDTSGHESFAELEKALAKLVGETRFLLVLDDVRHGAVWEDVLRRPLLQGAGHGSKVLVTTRHGSIAKEMGAGHVHRVKKMGADDGWLLLSAAAGVADEATAGELKDAGERIVEKCCGVPLAIKAVAGVLRTREARAQEWERIHRQSWSLKFLVLRGCKALHALPKGIEHLRGLRDLDLAGTVIDDAAFRVGHLRSLTSLRCFAVTSKEARAAQDRSGWPLDELKNLSQLRTLHIHKLEKVAGRSEATEMSLAAKKSLRELELSCSGTVMPLQTPELSFPPLGRLPELRSLYIADSSALKDIGAEFIGTNHPPGGISETRNLHLQGLQQLNEWRDIEPGSLPSLQVLQLESCPKLQSLPGGLRHVTSLTELRIADMASLEVVDDIATLKELSAWNTPNLERISNLPALVDINMCHCPVLEIVENVNRLRTVHIFDHDLRDMPKWIEKHASKLQSLNFTSTVGLLKRCLVDGPDWPVIKDIKEVHGYSTGSNYIYYTRSPYIFESNVSAEGNLDIKENSADPGNVDDVAVSSSDSAVPTDPTRGAVDVEKGHPAVTYVHTNSEDFGYVHINSEDFGSSSEQTTHESLAITNDQTEHDTISRLVFTGPRGSKTMNDVPSDYDIDANKYATKPAASIGHKLVREGSRAIDITEIDQGLNLSQTYMFESNVSAEDNLEDKEMSADPGNVDDVLISTSDSDVLFPTDDSTRVKDSSVETANSTVPSVSRLMRTISHAIDVDAIEAPMMEPKANTANRFSSDAVGRHGGTHDDVPCSIDAKEDDDPHQAPKVYTAIWADTDTDTIRARFVDSMRHLRRMASQRRHRRRKRSSKNKWSIGKELVPVLLIFSVVQLVFILWVVDAEVKPSPPPPEVGKEEAQIFPPEPPKREIVRVTRATIKEKASAFSSVGSAGKDGGSVPGGALSAAVFKRFHSSAPVARAEGGRAEAVEDGDLDFGGGGGDVRLDVEEIGAASRRPSPGISGRAPSVATSTGATPRPDAWWCSVTIRGRGRRGGGGDASGGGWWHGDMEGVDGEEVGWTDDMWEGMGSVTLGGLEWN